MATTFTVGTIDRLSKRTSMVMQVDDAATNIELQAIVDAVDGIILGAAASGTKTVATEIDAGSAVPPSDVNANRLNKWLLRVQDNVTGDIYTHEIGTADNSQLSAATSDYVDLAAGTGLALKTAIEAAYVSKAGNAGTLLSVQHVNRSGSQ